MAPVRPTNCFERCSSPIPTQRRSTSSLGRSVSWLISVRPTVGGGNTARLGDEPSRRLEARQRYHMWPGLKQAASRASALSDQGLNAHSVPPAKTSNPAEVRMSAVCKRRRCYFPAVLPRLKDKIRPLRTRRGYIHNTSCHHQAVQQFHQIPAPECQKMQWRRQSCYRHSKLLVACCHRM
jgi:hypothetical protein